MLVLGRLLARYTYEILGLVPLFAEAEWNHTGTTVYTVKAKAFFKNGRSLNITIKIYHLRNVGYSDAVIYAGRRAIKLDLSPRMFRSLSSVFKYLKKHLSSIYRDYEGLDRSRIRNHMRKLLKVS